MLSDSAITGFHSDTFLARVSARQVELKIRSERAVTVGAGLSANYLRNIRARKSGLTADALAKLASFLGCTTDYLLGRDGNMAPPMAERTVQPGE